MHALQDPQQILGARQVAALQGGTEHILDRVFQPAPQPGLNLVGGRCMVRLIPLSESG